METSKKLEVDSSSDSSQPFFINTSQRTEMDEVAGGTPPWKRRKTVLEVSVSPEIPAPEPTLTNQLSEILKDFRNICGNFVAFGKLDRIPILTIQRANVSFLESLEPKVSFQIEISLLQSFLTFPVYAKPAFELMLIMFDIKKSRSLAKEAMVKSASEFQVSKTIK